MMALPDALISLVHARRDGATVVVLTGAGISAESGIPTFRGPEGFWTVGSRRYKPQEIATWSTFQRIPGEVWGWYLFRRAACLAAAPNAAHHALVRLERALSDRFHLITQNVDGLHVRAGNSRDRTYEVHGNGSMMRCSARCTEARLPVPPELGRKGRGEQLSDEDRALLRCARCGAWMRPHVLWFDEAYEEAFYRSDTALRAAVSADVFVSIGTSGATSLPIHAASLAASRGALMIDLNPNPNPFSELAASQHPSATVRGAATATVPALVDALVA